MRVGKERGVTEVGWWDKELEERGLILTNLSTLNLLSDEADREVRGVEEEEEAIF